MLINNEAYRGMSRCSVAWRATYYDQSIICQVHSTNSSVFTDFNHNVVENHLNMLRLTWEQVIVHVHI